MPQQVEFEGLDREARDQLQRLDRGAEGAERLLMAMPVQQRGSAFQRRQRVGNGPPPARFRRIPRTAGRARRALWFAAPGRIAGNSSRKVNRQDGSSPTIGVPASRCGVSASSIRRASCRASSTRPGREKGPPAAQRPASRRVGVDDAVAGALQHSLGGTSILRLEVAVEGVHEQYYPASVLAPPHRPSPPPGRRGRSEPA